MVASKSQIPKFSRGIVMNFEIQEILVAIGRYWPLVAGFERYWPLLAAIGRYSPLSRSGKASVS